VTDATITWQVQTLAAVVRRQDRCHKHGFGGLGRGLRGGFLRHATARMCRQAMGICEGAKAVDRKGFNSACGKGDIALAAFILAQAIVCRALT
jgi:hypothetical protein